jgi:hypothetical protein
MRLYQQGPISGAARLTIKHGDGKSIVPTPKAAEFIKANAESGVVSGAAHGPQGGGTYTLADGRSFDLSLEDMRSMSMPKWDFDK